MKEENTALPSRLVGKRTLAKRGRVTLAFFALLSLSLTERATRDALRVITASYEYHGGFRLRTLSA